MTQPRDDYRTGTKSFTQYPHRDGFIVWNWNLHKWEWFKEEMV